LFADYPKIGLNADGHVITLNMFSFFSFDHVDVVVIDKSTVLDGNPETFTLNILSRPPESFTMAAATMHESQPGDPMWFVEETAYGTGGDTLRVVRLDNMLDDTAMFHDFEVPVTLYELGPFATQPNGSFNTGDSRMLNAAWRRDRLVTTHVIGQQNRAVAKWYEFNTESAFPTLVQEVVVDQGPGVDTFYPAVDINRAGDIGLTFLQSSPTQFVSMYVVGQPAGAEPGTQGVAAQVAEGNVTYIGGRGGDYAGIGVDPITDTFWSANEVIRGGVSNPLWSTWIGEFVVAPVADEDWYWFAANEGDDVTIELVRTLVDPTSQGAAWRPMIDVYAPDQSFVTMAQMMDTDDHLQLSFMASAAGSFRVRVRSQDESAGMYALNVSGTTATRPAPFIIDMEPSNGALVAELPTELRLRFSEGFRASSIDPTGFTIANQPVDDITLIDAVTLAIAVPTDLALPDGEVPIVIEPGAVVGLSGKSNERFQGGLVLDTTPPQLVDVTWNGASLPANSGVAATAATLSLVFNEPLFTLSSARRGLRTPGTDDILLQHRDTGAVIRPREMTYVSGSDTVHASFDALPEGDYELRLVSGSLAFEDRVGHPLDGDFNDTTSTGLPSGDGAAGGDFLLPFFVDADTTTITDMSPLLPLGTYVSRYETSGFIQFANDVDQFTLAALPGEFVRFVVRPIDVAATLSVNDQAASRPGDSVSVITSVHDRRPLTWNISSDLQTPYLLELFRNASAQNALPVSPNNSYRIDESALVLGDGARYVAIGELQPTPVETMIYENYFEASLGGFVIDNNVGVGGGLWHRSTGRSGDGLPNHSPNFSLYFGQAESSTSGGDYDRGHIRGTVRSPIISVPATGSPQLVFSHFLDREPAVLWDLAEVFVESDSGSTTLLSTSTGSLSNTDGIWQQVVASLDAFRGEMISIGFSFDTVDALSNDYEGWFIDDFRVINRLEPIHDIQRYYVDLSTYAGRTIDVLLTSQGGTDMSEVDISLWTPQGEVSGGSNVVTQQHDANYSRAIVGVTVPESGANDFYVEIDSRFAGHFALVITAGVSFELEPNSITPDSIRSISSSSWLLAHGDANHDPIDYYAVDVPQGRPMIVSRHARFSDADSLPTAEFQWLWDPELFTALELPEFFPLATRENSVMLLPKTAGTTAFGNQVIQGEQSYQLEFDLAVGSGDLNDDEVMDCVDLSLLVVAFLSGSYNFGHDISQDGHIDHVDLALWFVLSAIANLPNGQQYRPGDVDLDGVVDAIDLQTLQSHLFTTTASACQGDLNFDGSVDVRDFNLWQRHKFTGAAAAPSQRAATSRIPRAALGKNLAVLPQLRVAASRDQADLNGEHAAEHEVSANASSGNVRGAELAHASRELIRSRLMAQSRRSPDTTNVAARDELFSHKDIVNQVRYDLSHSVTNSSSQ
jgi:hypothetical protein